LGSNLETIENEKTENTNNIIPIHTNGKANTNLPGHIPESLHNKLKYGDPKSVEKGCAFLQRITKNNKDTTDLEVFASLGILSFLKDGDLRAIEIFKDDKNQVNQTKNINDRIIYLRQNAKGPRTCKSIHETTNGKDCNKCPNKDKVITPAEIKSENIYPHEPLGFCTINEKTGKLTPYYNEIVDKLVDTFNLKYFGDTDSFFTYKEKNYEPIIANKIKTRAANLSKRKYLDYNLSETMAQLKVLESINSDQAWIKETTNNKLNLSNGVLDFNTMELLPHSDRFGFTSIMDYEYRPSATSPIFEKFMLDVSQNDLEWIAVLQEWIGYILVPGFPYGSKCLWFYGPESSNGKNTMAKMISSLLPQQDVTNIRIENLCDPTYLVDLLNSKLNVADETNKIKANAFGQKMDLASTLNMLITAEKLKVRGSYMRRAIELENWARLIFMSNDLPTLDSVKGFDRRVMYVPFDAKFDDTNKDIYMLEKLKTERSGILNFAIEGYLRLKKNNFKFSDCARITDLTKQNIKNKNVYFEWAHNTFTFNQDSKLSKDQIRDRHRKDMQTIGEQPLSDKILFGTIFKQAFNLSQKDLDQKIYEGVNPVRSIKNVAFKSEYED
jgi:P4 family phage/plasmid primase-like protien